MPQPAHSRACGWGVKRIAASLGCSHHTVKNYVAAGGVVPFKRPQRAKMLKQLLRLLQYQWVGLVPPPRIERGTSRSTI